VSAGRAPRSPARAEIVGSLLRPPALRDAIDAVYEPGHRALLAEERAKDLTALRRAEDDAIREAVARQIDLGLDVVSDGEFRRYMFLNSFWDAVEGFSTDRNPVEFRDERGETVTWHVQRIEERLRMVDSPAAREAAFLAGATGDRPFKVTFPAASLFVHPFTFRPQDAYADAGELVSHCIEIERALIADAVEAGAMYVQLDFPLYPYLVDPAWRGRFEAAGFDLADVLDAAIAADTAVLEGIPDGVTIALHYRLTNPNGFDIDLRTLSYRLEVEGRQLVQGELPAGVRIRATGDTPIAIPVRLRWRDLPDFAQLLLTRREVAYRISGEAGVGSPVGTVGLPFDHADRVALPRLPSLGVEAQGRAAP